MLYNYTIFMELHNEFPYSQKLAQGWAMKS